jgi:hypothetical protein
MGPRELNALETMENVVAYLQLRIKERDAAIERLIDSSEDDRRRLLRWMLERDRGETEPPRPHA